MIVEANAGLIAGIILLLPWALKTAGLWDKVKKWYKYLFMGMMFGLIAVTMNLFAVTSYLPIFQDSAIFWMVEFMVEVVAVILLAVGALGMSAKAC